MRHIDLIASLVLSKSFAEIQDMELDALLQAIEQQPRSSKTEECIRAAFLESEVLDPPLTHLQTAHLKSPLFQTRLQTEPELTVWAALTSLAEENLPPTFADPLDASWYKNVAAGFSVQDGRQDWITATHISALESSISLATIVGLTENQVSVILKTRDTEYPTTRNDVEEINVRADHLDALRNGYDFNDIKHLNELQIKGLLQKPGFLLEDVKAPWFSEKHVDALQNNYLTIDKMRGLESFKLDAVIDKFLTIEEVRELTALQIEALKWGVDRKIILEEKTPVSKMQLACLQAGISFERIKDKSFTQVHQELFEQFRFSIYELIVPWIQYVINRTENLSLRVSESAGFIRRLYQQKISLETLQGLTDSQFTVLSRGRNISVEDIQNPQFAACLAKLPWYKQDQPSIQALRKYSIDRLQALEPYRLEALVFDRSVSDLTLEDVENPAFSVELFGYMQWFVSTEKKDKITFKGLIDKRLTAEQLMFLKNGASLEQVQSSNLTPLHAVYRKLMATETSSARFEHTDMTGQELLVWMTTPLNQLASQKPLIFSSTDLSAVPPVPVLESTVKIKLDN